MIVYEVVAHLVARDPVVVSSWRTFEEASDEARKLSAKPYWRGHVITVRASRFVVDAGRGLG